MQERTEQLRIKYREESFTHQPYTLEKDFLRLFARGNPKAFHILEEIRQYPEADLGNQNPVRAYKNKLIIAVALLTRTAAEEGLRQGELYTLSDDYILRIESLEQTALLKELEEKIFDDFFQRIRQHHAANQSQAVLACQSYIDDHLHEPLDLHQLAEFVQLHPNYLSRRFKQEVGVTIQTYILQERIEEAKIMLRFTSGSIMDIATYLQFSSQSYFTRQFHKAVGVTPKVFRDAAEEKL
ncbi:helix-turn-helix domain-containing protein [Alkalicoccus chagannorensis]|uniref:helix-turn-helix domain-containing protein n=1 Tax=Alkalicoccus chagannorensis TaxID=427072 RepID=UPI0003FA085C|nr:AraC family transcriptional regulator [Alkalicoccus chagannorensis]